MKRNLLLSLGVLAFALVPALAQQPPAAAGPGIKVHGHVTNPTGAPQGDGTVTYLEIIRPSQGPGLPPQTAERGTFNVDASGDYTGEVPAGKYAIVYRSAGMEKDKEADRIENITVAAGAENVGDVDMSRAEYIAKLPDDQKKQLEELRKKNSEALKANEVIKNLNADLKVVVQDLKDSDGAHAQAAQELGASASHADLEAKANEIKTAKYTDVETLDDQGHRGPAGRADSLGLSRSGAGGSEEVRRRRSLLQEVSRCRHRLQEAKPRHRRYG